MRRFYPSLKSLCSGCEESAVFLRICFIFRTITERINDRADFSVRTVKLNVMVFFCFPRRGFRAAIVAFSAFPSGSLR